MQLGVQFTGTVGAYAKQRWFTFSWPADWYVVWMVVPTSPNYPSEQIEWKVQVERQDSNLLTYFIEVTNVSAYAVNIEARYAILN